jgi:predicted ester cyclase
LIPEVVSFIQAQSSHFKEVYAYLCTALTDSLSKALLSQSQDQLMVEESKQPTSGNFQQRLNDFLNIPKEKLSLVQDQV